ncbi:Uncharacterized [Syntrophomonas zehnderi OL-4]|uniref:Uncharacterized n=1 Tax=Syntrophomonas zehnderi OL-4 TaxID=690567 RepID=A0A0E4GAU4_9FIRM|nr:hypothetical protein [Syntrophomonas zehnderi]CFX21876.1 Uncharacterized [Syntrophomonas zehnderi OL-4]
MTQAKNSFNSDYNSTVVYNEMDSRNYSTKSAELMEPLAFPRSVEEIYNLGISLQYYIGGIYLKLANTSKGEQKKNYSQMALAQLNVKKTILQLINENLNEKLTYFYNNGGPIINPPVSEREAKELSGFFNRIAANYLNQIDAIVTMAAKRNTDADELKNEIDNIIVHMYGSLSNLYQHDDLKQAFHNMAELVGQL